MLGLQRMFLWGLSTQAPMETGGHAGEMVDIGDREYVGGGELLRYLFRDNWDWKRMDSDLMDNLMHIQVYKLLIIISLLVTCTILVLKILGYQSLIRDRGITSELANRSVLERYEKKILKYNKSMRKIVSMVESVGLGVGEGQKEYLDYNLRRAGASIIGCGTVLNASEYNAIIKIGTSITVVITLLIMLFVSLPGGTLLLIISLIAWSVLPLTFLRVAVSQKDRQIKNSFFDFYIKMHYALKLGDNLRLAAKARNFIKSDSSGPEASEFAGNCADLWELYGEGDGSLYIAREYREIPEVGKLMRLVKQYHDGANIQSDLDGFRQQLLLEKEMVMERKQEILINKCRASSKILMIILVQVLISTFAIYVPDLMGASNLMK